MRVWKNVELLLRRVALARVVLLGALCLTLPNAHAAGIFVRSADTELSDKVYRLDASIDYKFSSEALKALHNGVPLYVSLEIEVMRYRGYWWDETIASLEQRYELAYYALADQYLVKNINSGARYSFATLPGAVESLGKVTDLPLLDKNLLKRGETYTGRIRARLDVERLPTPLRLLSYVSSGWRLSSEWYVWPIQHEN